MNDSKVLNGENELINPTVDGATSNVATEDTVAAKDTVETTETKEKKSVSTLTHLDDKFVYELMAVPTCSRHEYRLVTFIMLWAKRNNVEYEFDDYGNIYLTKGTVGEGEYYPCMTAHLDTVQDKQKAYIQAGVELEVLTRKVKGNREIYVDGMGIGGDDKAGVLIALSMFKHVDTLKAAFFLEEEVGCLGSKKLNKVWFENVGYVLGYDSPDLNRAAWSCSGVKLFSGEFFKEHMQEICKKHGLTKFYSEPYTDVKEIRQATNIMCMNFGSGYYNGHAPNEYCVIEEMDTACRMGHDLITHLGKTRHELEHKEKSYIWTKNDKGVYGKPNDGEDDDETFLKSLGDTTKYPSYGTGATYAGGAHYRGGQGYVGGAANRQWDDEYGDTYGRGSNVRSVASGTYAPKVEKKEGDVNIETVRYICEKYDNQLVRIEQAIRDKCTKSGLDFETEFASIFSKVIKF